MRDRRRNALILLLVFGLVAASGVAIGLRKTVLGLDLKGGIELVYQGKPTQISAVNSDSLNRAITIMRKRVDQLGVTSPTISTQGKDQIVVQLPDQSNAQRAIDQVGKTAQLQFYDWETNVIGPDGKPSASNTTATGDAAGDPGGVASGLPQYQAVLRASKRPPILRKGIDTTWGPGCTKALNIAKPGSSPNAGCVFGQWYLVDHTAQTVLAGPEDTRADLYSGNSKPLPKHHNLEAVHVNPGTVVVQATPEVDTAGNVTVASPNSWYVLDDKPVLTGADITNPAASTDNGPSGSGQPIVTFGFNGAGGRIFQAVTKAIAQRGQAAQLPGVTKAQAEQHFAVVLDNQLITVPYIDYTSNPDGVDPTNGSEIQGGFTLASAQNLAQELQSGALPIKLALISESQVSATLGKQALNQGLIAGAIGLLAVCIFLLAFYRLLGVVAIGGLAIYGAYFYALIKLIPVTLTLAGIAGLILTIGVAADANIVIFERVKEEIRGGRSVIAGIALGYKRGFEAIIDANVVTIMVAFILFVLSTADVKGFALTLGIGTIVSLFTAVLATRAALGVMGRSGLITNNSSIGAGKARHKWHFDFMGRSKWFFSLSGTILLIGALAIGGRGLNVGIDFKGGTVIQTGLQHAATVNQVRSVLSNVSSKFGNAEIQALSSVKNGYRFSVEQLGPNQLTSVHNALDSHFGVRNFSDTSIGPTFGKTIANSALIAIIASLIVISIYIALRFEWKYAVPVLIALMHDLLITAGVYALTGREVTADTVAALLTILGYSLYDTIIVFDRVRENVPRMPRAAFSQIVNRSMSEVLTRSLATSFCTLLPIVALLLFGGATLSDFAFALMIGVMSGAYSSIFIASPVLTHWKEREPVYRNRRVRITAELGAVPAYAVASAGAPVDVEPSVRKRGRRRGLAEVPGDQISPDEFDDLVRDISDEVAEGSGAGGPTSGRRATPRASNGSPPGGTATKAPPARGTSTAGSGTKAAPPAAAPPAAQLDEPAQDAPEVDPAADALPEDVVMPGTSRPRPPRARRRHGRPR